MLLLIKFGGTQIQTDDTNLKELTIIQDINKFLPEFKLKLGDSGGLLTHLVPSDRKNGKVYIELAQDPTDQKTKNAWAFTTYTRTPEGDQSNPSAVFSIDGLLDVDGLFTKDESRGFSGTIYDTIEEISGGLTNIFHSEISPSLTYEKNLVQPTWTNAQFLNYLKENIAGSNDEYGFKCFVKTLNQRNIFTFSSISEMVKNAPIYKFILSPYKYQDRYPVFNYYVYDNYKLYGTFASKTQAYSYFDYENSEFIQEEEVVEDYEISADYYLIDKADNEDSNSINNTGRNSDFTENFLGKVKGSYGNRIHGLVKMWITTEGLASAVPGQMVHIFFPQSALNIYDYQYTGNWLVERVVHNIGGSIFLTKLLLTRGGIDTAKTTTLLPA
jgi:hypothetical protein